MCSYLFERLFKLLKTWSLFSSRSGRTPSTSEANRTGMGPNSPVEGANWSVVMSHAAWTWTAILSFCSAGLALIVAAEKGRLWSWRVISMSSFAAIAQRKAAPFCHVFVDSWTSCRRRFLPSSGESLVLSKTAILLASMLGMGKKKKF